MAEKGFGKFRMAGTALLLLLAVGVAFWIERASLLAWLQVRGLARAGDADRPRWVERVANLGEAAVPHLITLLHANDPQPCCNARAALDHMVGQWGLEDPRTADLVCQLTQAFAHLSIDGQENTLGLGLGWLSSPDNRAGPAAPLRAALVPFLAASVDQSEEVRSAALDLSAALLAPPSTEEALVPTRVLVRSCLQAESPALRVRAVKLTLLEGLELLELVVPLLEDPAPEVRRAAILATGPADHLVRDESLLPCLHDPDPEVRGLCEQALQGRGLRPEHLHLGRLLTDPRPVVRLQVLDHLSRAADLDHGLWLRRLSHDPSAAVRAGAVRMMSQLAHLDLSDRIDQMTRSDPSPTVSDLARYYLKGRRLVLGTGEP